MDNDSKSQQPGSLKIMTVFIVVLALHVIVIGGITVYHLVSGSSDADLTGDKTQKKDALADNTTPDATSADKPAGTTDATTPPTNPQPAAADQTAPQITPPAPATTVTQAPPPAPSVASVPAPQPQGPPASTDVKPSLAPPPDSSSIATTGPQTPTGPINSDGAPVTPAPLAGPVHMPTPSAHTAAVEHEHGQVYTVKITDSYKKIAHTHHITVAQLKEANHITGNVLHAGQKLIIPSSKTVLADAATTSLDAQPEETHLQPTTAVYSTSTVAPAPHRHLYTVEKGDTLKKIARKFNTSPSAILEANSISNPAKLTIGKKLRIPSPETRSARVTTPEAMPPAVPPVPSQVQSAPTHVEGESTTTNGELANFAP